MALNLGLLIQMALDLGLLIQMALDLGLLIQMALDLWQDDVTGPVRVLAHAY